MGLRSYFQNTNLKILRSCVSSKTLVLSCIFFVALFQNVNSIKLDDDGAYHVVLAIDRKTAKNNIENYVDNIKLGLQRLSDFLHISTDKKFYIKSVEIVLPEHWNFPINGVAAINYFENSDIRISHEFQEPYVYNPKICGTAGEYMQLPYDFFNKEDEGGHYGRVGSVLLNQWVKYRYGVWEEHGYPLDPVYPYFFQSSNISITNWNTNYCANINLAGEIKNLDDGVACELEEFNPPNYNCRFFPNEDQRPTTSLTSFNFINSVQRFCDNVTHIRNAPNRQNILCGYQSVREVMEASPDWEFTSTEIEVPRPIAFTVLRVGRMPLLSLVLDGGLTQAPGFVIEQIRENLKTLVNESRNLPEGIIATVGSFSAEAENLGKSLYEELPWSDIKKHKENIENAIDASFSKKSGFRDFASAIKEATDNIKHRQHEFGCIMVIVKTGEATNFDKLYYEDEVIESIKELGIKLYIFEVKGNILKPSLNLQNLATETGGIHYTISGTPDLKEMLSRMDHIAEELRNFTLVSVKKYRTMYKGVVNPGDEILLSVAEVEKLNFHLIPIGIADITTGPVVEQMEEDEDGLPVVKESVPLGEKYDWNPKEPGTFRKTYNGIFVNREDNVSQPETQYWKITYACSGTCPSSYLFISGEFSNDTTIQSDAIQVFVTTSALNGQVDLHTDLQYAAITRYNTPFGIYAKLQHNGFPIKNVGENVLVKAILSLRDSSSYWTVDLVDDGTRSPDLTSNDGIFSGSFVPNVNGIFKISVQITFLSVREDDAEDGSSTTVGTTESVPEIYLKNSGRSVAVGQGLIGCGTDFSGCWATVLPFDFTKVVDYTKTVIFNNARDYEAVPQKVHDLQVSYNGTGSNASHTVRFEWTQPAVVDASGIVTNPYEYYLVYSEDFEKLADDFTSGGLVVPIDEIGWPAEPGTRFVYTKNWGYNTTYFYAMRSMWYYSADDRFSPPSNIVGITSVDIAPVTETPATPPITSTTTSTTTTTTTTAAPSTATTPTTTTERTTKLTTSRRTTLSTTTRATVPTPTGGVSASTAPPKQDSIKHWYQEPEGYITLSVFGVAFVVLTICGFGYLWKKNRTLAQDKERFMQTEGPIV